MKKSDNSFEILTEKIEAEVLEKLPEWLKKLRKAFRTRRF